MKKIYLGLILVVLSLSACSINGDEVNESINYSENQVIAPGETEVDTKEGSTIEETYKGWFLFYTKPDDIAKTNLKTDTYYLLKKDDINDEFTMVEFNENKAAVQLIELSINEDANCKILSDIERQRTEDTCLNLIDTMPNGLYGDRVNVTGVMQNGKLSVASMDIISFLPASQW